MCDVDSFAARDANQEAALQAYNEGNSRQRQSATTFCEIDAVFAWRVYGLHLAGALPTGIGNPTSEVVSWLVIFRSSSWAIIAAYGCETVRGNTSVRRSVSDNAFLFHRRLARPWTASQRRPISWMEASSHSKARGAASSCATTMAA